MLLGEAEALAGRRCATPARSSSAPCVAGRGRRLRDRRQPRPADRRLGALGRRARARDVPQAGDDAAAHAPTGSRASGRRSRRSPRPRACPRTRRRCGDESARARVPRRTPGRRRPTRSRGSPGIDPSQVVRFDQNTPPLPLPLDAARRRSPARSPASTATRPAATATLRRGDRRLHRRRARRTSCSARAPTT